MIKDYIITFADGSADNAHGENVEDAVWAYFADGLMYAFGRKEEDIEKVELKN